MGPAGPGRPRRWPWLLGTGVPAAVAAALTLQALGSQIYFEPTADAHFAAWVGRPKIAGYGAALLVLVVAALVLLARRWTPTVRTAVTGLAVLLAAGSGAAGAVPSQAREHIAPRLLAAAAQVPAPDGAQPAGAPELERSRPVAGSLSSPRAVRTWQVGDGSRTAVCGALERTFAGMAGWSRTPGGCGFVRFDGDLTVSASVGLEPGRARTYVARVAAEPYTA